MVKSCITIDAVIYGEIESANKVALEKVDRLTELVIGLENIL